MPARVQGSTASSGNDPPGNTRHNMCAHCTQIGHASNDYPQVSQFGRPWPPPMNMASGMLVDYLSSPICLSLTPFQSTSHFQFIFKTS
ncbi:hypothetical protein Dimus_035668 [Dionaea muscipula]